MKLIFLGSGSAFTVGADNYQSNMLLVADNGQKLLIDCGSDIRFSLYAMGLSYLDINNIYISHIHADHTGGLEYIGFTNKFDPRCQPPKLYIMDGLDQHLWSSTLSGGMGVIEYGDAELSTYFDVQKIHPDHNFFTWEGIEFQTVHTIHIANQYKQIPSYGLFFTLGKIKIFITTDTCFLPDKLGEFYQQADLIFHDCETAKFKSPVHTHYQDLLTLPQDIKSKMWLYHYQPGTLPDAIKDGFKGFVKRGQIFDCHPTKHHELVHSGNM
jgi:ribonuclease BN (tRNA processing enzyme)